MPRFGIWLRFLKHKLEGNRELDIAVRHLKAGTMAIDVGARRGIYSWVMSKHVGQEGQVLSFEPNPFNAEFLRKLFESRANVTVAEFGLSDSPGQSVLNVPIISGIPSDALGHVGERADSTEVISYPIHLTTLDNYLSQSPPKKVSFIKIDVEGHELSVLKGCEVTLRTQRPAVFIEIDQTFTPEPISTRFDYLKKMNYDCFYLSNEGALRPLEFFDVESMQIEPSRRNLRFVNMFLFVPRELARSNPSPALGRL